MSCLIAHPIEDAIDRASRCAGAGRSRASNHCDCKGQPYGSHETDTTPGSYRRCHRHRSTWRMKLSRAARFRMGLFGAHSARRRPQGLRVTMDASAQKIGDHAHPAKHRTPLQNDDRRCRGYSTYRHVSARSSAGHRLHRIRRSDVGSDNPEPSDMARQPFRTGAVRFRHVRDASIM